MNNYLTNKTSEPFTNLSDIKNNLNDIKNYKLIKQNYDIINNFSIEEFKDVIKNLELKAIKLTKEQITYRKKYLTNIKKLLLSFKDSGKINEIVNKLPSLPEIQLPQELQLSNIGLDKLIPSDILPNINTIKINTSSFFTLLENIIDLYLKEINDIENKDSYNFYFNILSTIIVILIIFLMILSYLYFNSNSNSNSNSSNN
jgi:hypothetical protein